MPSRAISAVATITIWKPVGTPSRSTAPSTFGSSFTCFSSSGVGASGLPLRIRCQASHAIATNSEISEAAAALATPICGRPNVPRISAGVTSRPTPVDSASVHSGVTASPTPRRMEVASRKAKKTGIEIIMMRA